DGADALAPVLQPPPGLGVLRLQRVHVVDRHHEVVLDHHVPLTRGTAPPTAATGATAAPRRGGPVAGRRRRVPFTVDVGTTTAAGWTLVGTSGRGHQDDEHRRRHADQEASAHPATPSNRCSRRAADTFHTPSTRVISA